MALIFVPALYLMGVLWVSKNILDYLNIAAIIAFAVCILILIPCALFREARKVSAYGFYISSVIFGVSTWILGFLVTFEHWGGTGVFLGVIMGVVGIVPIGMLASALLAHWPQVGDLALGLVLTYGARFTAITLAVKMDRDDAGINLNSTSESTASQPTIARDDQRRPEADSNQPEYVQESAVAAARADTIRALSQEPESRKTRQLSKWVARLLAGARDAALVTACVLGLVVVGSLGDWLSETWPTPASPSKQAGSKSETAFDPDAYLKRPEAGPFADAVAAYRRGDYATALRLFRPLADRGNARAQYRLGDMYANGDGVTQNSVEAVKWLRLAANQGLADAENGLGFAYWNGLGVPRDYAQAVKWFRLSADQGHAEAQFNLGSMYFNGPLPQNYAEAVKWYRLAATQGNPDAQFFLGIMYSEGHGVPQDYVSAHMWVTLSAAQRDQKMAKIAADFLEIIEPGMTPAQIAEAQKLGRAWKSKSTPR
jgi:TPR repeat protein